MKEFARFDLSRVVERLREFAADAGLEGETTTYVLWDQALISHHRVLEDSSLLMRTISRYGRLITVELPFDAERIVVGANARVFGLQAMNGVTAKVRIHHSHRIGQSFFRDCVARRILAPLNRSDGWSIPRVHKRDAHGTWLIEDYVAGEQIGADDMEHFISRHALGLYAITARLRPVIRSPHHAWLVDEISKTLGEVAPSFANVQRGAQWPVGIGHGDLNTQNVLKGERYWLVDWECAGVRPIVLDLAHAYLAIPTVRPAVLDVLRALDPAGLAMPPIQQLAFGAAFEMRKRSNRRVTKVERNSRAMGIPSSQAAMEFDREMARYRAAVAALED